MSLAELPGYLNTMFRISGGRARVSAWHNYIHQDIGWDDEGEDIPRKSIHVQFMRRFAWGNERTNTKRTYYLAEDGAC